MLMNVVLLNCTDFSCYSSKPTYQNWCAGTLDTVTASNIACCSDGPNQDNSFFVINTTYRIKGIHSYSCAFLLCLIETTRAAAGIDLWSGRWCDIMLSQRACWPCITPCPSVTISKANSTDYLSVISGYTTVLDELLHNDRCSSDKNQCCVNLTIIIYHQHSRPQEQLFKLKPFKDVKMRSPICFPWSCLQWQGYLVPVLQTMTMSRLCDHFWRAQDCHCGVWTDRCCLSAVGHVYVQKWHKHDVASGATGRPKQK